MAPARKAERKNFSLSGVRHPPRPSVPAYVSICPHTSAYVSIRQHTSAYVSIRQQASVRQHTSAYCFFLWLITSIKTSRYDSSVVRHPPRPFVPAYVSIRPHTSADEQIRLVCCPSSAAPFCTCIRQHTSAYISIRQHTTRLLSVIHRALLYLHTSAYGSGLKVLYELRTTHLSLRTSALLRLYQGSIKALLRLYQGSLKALLRLC